MRLGTRLRHVSLPLVAVAFAVIPLANPLLLALAAFAAGSLLAYRCLADLLSVEAEAIGGGTVFRHYV